MFRLGLGILLGWLIFDEEGKKASNKAGKFIKDKSGEAIDYASKHIDTDKVADFVKKQISPKGIAENIAQDVAEDAIIDTVAEEAVLGNTAGGILAGGILAGGILAGETLATERNNENLNQIDLLQQRVDALAAENAPII